MSYLTGNENNASEEICNLTLVKLFLKRKREK